MTQKDHADEVQLGEVFQQSRQNAEQLSQLGNKLDSAIVELRKAIEQSSERSERLIDQVRRATSPNMANIWMGIGVAISFIALIGTVFGYGITREIGRLDFSFDRMDGKVQRVEQRQWDRITDENKELRDMLHNKK